MASVLLISTTGSGAGAENLEHIARSARQDAFKVHSVTDDAGSADLILFFEPEDACLAHDVRSHALSRRYPEKTFLFDSSDRVLAFLPGVYASIRRRHYDRSRVRAGFYSSVMDHDWITYDAERRPALLFSFLGWMRGNPLREAIGRLRHPRALLRDTAGHPCNLDERPGPELDRFRCEFADSLAASKFVLCPRGLGASTLRLFEAMKAGSVPVILSDDWVAPEGPAWESFALVVPEREVERVPAMLEARESVAVEMGRRAREAWEQWFSETAAFHRIVESCLDIRRSRVRPERVSRKLVFWQLLEPFNLRYRLMPGLRKRLLG